MKRTMFTTLALAGLALAGCGSAGGGESDDSSSGPIRVAAIPATTGATADFGESALRAITFAADQQNKAGGVDGRKVEVIRVSTDGTPAATVRAASRAVTQDGARFIIGSMTSAEQSAVQQQLRNLKAISIAAIPTDDALTGKNCSVNSFRTRQTDAMNSQALTKGIGSRLKGTWAIQGTDNVTAHTSASNFKAAVEKAGGRVVVESYSPSGTQDFGSAITKLKRSGAENLFAAEYGSDAAAFVNQGSQFKLFQQFKVVAGNSFVSEPLFKPLGDKILGFYNNVSYASVIDTPGNKRFVQAWTARFGAPPSFVEGSTYLGMEALFAAVKTAKSNDPDKVRDAFRTLSFDSVLGPVKMRAEDHQLLAPTYAGRVVRRNGTMTWQLVGRYDASETAPRANPDCKL